MIDQTRLLLSSLIQKHGNAVRVAIQAILQAALPKNALVVQVIDQFINILMNTEVAQQKDALQRAASSLKEDQSSFPHIVALIAARFDSILVSLVQMEKMGVGVDGLNSLAVKNIKESQEQLVKDAFEMLTRLGGQLKQMTDQKGQSAIDFQKPDETPSTQFSPAQDDGSPKIGDVIGDSDWRLLELLGKGGMGSVWKAKNAFDQVGALKLMLPHLLSNDKLIQRFRLEILSLMKVKHPNIVALCNWGRDRSNGKDRWYFVTDFIEGKSLAKILQENGPLDLEIAKNIFIKLAEGLAVAHEQGVIHRDIKPGNIMIRTNWDPVLIDFGIARQLEDTSLTQTHERVLTLQFASPEQLYGEPVSERSDVFSLAATLMFCLSPDPKRQRPRFEPQLVPDAFHFLLDRALNYQAENRPANMKEFVELLNQIVFQNGKLLSYPKRGQEQGSEAKQNRVEVEIGGQISPNFVNVPAVQKSNPLVDKSKMGIGTSPQTPVQSVQAVQSTPNIAKPSTNGPSNQPAPITAASMPLIAFDEQYHYLDPNGQQKKATLLEIIEAIKANPKSRHMVWKKGWPEWQSWHKVDAFKNYLQAQKESQTQQFSTQNMMPFSKINLETKGGGNLAMICVPPGSFWMGNQNTDAEADEKPRHKVILTKGFLLSECQVTQDFYESVVNFNPSLYKYPNHPVERVSWHDTVRFCNALSEQQGLKPVYEFKENSDELVVNLSNDGYRLPTEAEWEYAAKAGTQFTYAGSNRPDEVAWFGASRRKEGQRTYPVKEKQPNGWGFYDMSGNVWEWCTDDMRIYQREDVVDPIGDMMGSQKVSKGGSNYLDARQTRCSYRIRYPNSTRSNFVGFRLAKNL